MNCEPAGREYPGMNEQQIDIDMSHRGIHMQMQTWCGNSLQVLDITTNKWPRSSILCGYTRTMELRVDFRLMSRTPAWESSSCPPQTSSAPWKIVSAKARKPRRWPGSLGHFTIRPWIYHNVSIYLSIYLYIYISIYINMYINNNNIYLWIISWCYMHT